MQGKSEPDAVARRPGDPAYALGYRIRRRPPNGTTSNDGHMFCMGSVDPPWGSEVLDFLRETMTPDAR